MFDTIKRVVCVAAFGLILCGCSFLSNLSQLNTQQAAFAGGTQFNILQQQVDTVVKMPEVPQDIRETLAILEHRAAGAQNDYLNAIAAGDAKSSAYKIVFDNITDSLQATLTELQSTGVIKLSNVPLQE